MENTDFDLKKELIQKAKELAENPAVANLNREVADLKKKWRRPYDDESLYEKELQDEFDSYLSVINSFMDQNQQTVEEKKNEIIAKAKELTENVKSFKSVSAKMKDLMTEWKEAGHIEKEKDNELWEQFNAIREEFYTKRQAYYDGLAERFAKAKEAKEELILKAKEANKLENFKELTNTMNELMEEWKKVGNAGKEHDDELWSQFLAERQEFFKKRNLHSEEMKERFAKCTAAKNEIIAKAKRYLAISEFSKDEVDAVKALRQEWKEVGYAGRDNDDKLWNEFSSIVNKYFDNKRFYEK